MNKKFAFFSRESILELKRLELAIQSPPFPYFQIKKCDFFHWPKNSFPYLINFVFQLIPTVIVKGLVASSQIKQPDFGNIKWFLSYVYTNLYEKIQKTASTRKAINSKPLKTLVSKYTTTILKAFYKSNWNFNSVFFETTEKKNPISTGWCGISSK